MQSNIDKTYDTAESNQTVSTIDAYNLTLEKDLIASSNYGYTILKANKTINESEISAHARIVDSFELGEHKYFYLHKSDDVSGLMKTMNMIDDVVYIEPDVKMELDNNPMSYRDVFNDKEAMNFSQYSVYNTELARAFKE